jgi:hypothetical protein
MKNFTFSFILKSLFIFCFIFLAVSLMAQTSEPATYPEMYSALVGALTMTWGLVANALGLKKDINKFVFVVIAGAIVIIGIFLALGFGDGISHAIAVFTSMGIFDLLKGITKKKK